MRIAGTIQDSIVDGPGFRFVVFSQGCMMRCEGCHNPATWDPEGGEEVPTDELIRQMLSNPLTDGLTLSGGEPFLQAGQCAELAKAARDSGLNVWVYTGYTFESLLALAESDPEVKALLYLTDVLVDGPFVPEEKSYDIKWRGSRNQRVLDVPKSVAAGEAVEKGE